MRSSTPAKLSLPIDSRIDRIKAAVVEHRGLVLSAEPGAGKTTRLPPALLGLTQGEILVVEPRRIAARLAATRVAYELGEKLGERIGYRVRFDSKTSARTRLTFLTEGILLRRLSQDPTLKGVGTLVFDELHERHLQSDLALALARRMQQQNPKRELNLVAMSATLDAGPIASFLDVPHIHVEGRTFPVEVHHADKEDSRDLEVQVAVAVKRALKEQGGDVLVFLPGAAEIRRAAKRCRAICAGADVDLMTLHGSLPAAEQDRVVRPGQRRKVVLSTNVAESSVTLPNVTTVIDSGLARLATHSPWTGLPSLTVQRVSQASAIQRAGRAGRVRAGQAVRLYTAHDFRRRPEFETPEIQRLDLSEMVLLLKSQQQDPRHFPFFEAPPEAAIDAAEGLLTRLGALEGQGLSATGRALLRLPVHPRLGRIVTEGLKRRVGHRACTVAALIGERSIRSYAGDRSRENLEASADVLVDLEALEAAEAERLRDRELAARGIHAPTLSTVRRVAKQLRRAVQAPAIKAGLTDEEEELRSAIVAGFPDRIGKLQGRRIVFAGGGSGQLDDSCVVRRGEFAAALEVQDRTERGGRGRTLIRSACEVEPEMILDLFADEIEETNEVRFDKDTQQVEQVLGLSFYGLVLDESVHRDGYGPEVSACLANAAQERGLAKLFDMDAVELLRRRVAFAHAGGLALPLIDDGRLQAALIVASEHRRSFADLKGVSLTEHLVAGFDPALFSRLKKAAPEFVSLPRRKRVPVNYEIDRAPWIASRLQDFFGLKQGPMAGGQPLVLHLLAPNRRAVQVTTDLSGFWERHYPALRRQLMRRYSRHDWPEDPR